jgi:hypothetical protein
MTFMHTKHAATPVIPAVSSASFTATARVTAALALMAATVWVAYEAVADQNEQHMIQEMQLGDRP